MHISIRAEAGQSVCAGAIGGRQLLSRLLALTAREPTAPEPVLLDFSGVDVATASYLRESVITFRNFVRGRRSNVYPVTANLNSAIAEELSDMLNAQGDAMLACETDDDGKVQSVKMLGRLEAKQQRVLALIHERREIDAGQLQREFGDNEGVKQTSWNNRLSSLANLGLVFEFSDGRNKRYRPIFAGA